MTRRLNLGGSISPVASLLRMALPDSCSNGRLITRTWISPVESKPVKALTASIFSQHPLMLRIGSEFFVRAVAGVQADGSLKFYCAMEKGLVLRIGEGHAADEALRRTFSGIREKIGEPVVIVGYDCILRRLELEEEGIADRVGQLMAENRVFGFSTYGEQYNSLHVNQTFTGVALGANA